MKKITVRDIPNDTHARLLEMKEMRDRSVNKLIVQALKEFTGTGVSTSAPARPAPKRRRS